jgi:hypothetical protein
MTDEIIRSITTIAVAIVGIATLSVIVSRNAQTPQVIQAAGGSFSDAIRAAVSPVSGGASLGVNPFNTF